MKRIITLLLIICMTACMTLSFTACGSRNKSQAEEQTAAVEESETAEEPEAQSEYPKTMYVNAEDGLMLRKGPAKDSDVVHRLSHGQELTVEKAENGWAYTTVDGKSGWCSMEFLTGSKDNIKKIEEESSSSGFDPNQLVVPGNTYDSGFHGYVDSPEGLNLRYGPGQDYGIIDVIPDKTDLIERGSGDGWVYVEYKGQYGWISAQYFIMEGGKEKPVIYLYPERTTDVNVRITLTDGEFTKSIPEGDGEWNVTADPDGQLTDKASGETYDYIFWESTDNTEYDWSEGYVVKGCDAGEFLLRILPEMGLNSKEYSEFIDYWLPRLEKNEYNLISFQTDRYTESARLDVYPEPDSVLRVFMAFKKIDGPVFVARPEIAPFERKGFTVVEWGGAEVR